MGMGNNMIIIKINLNKILKFLQLFLDFAVVVFFALYIFTAILFRDRLVNIFGYEFNIVQSQSMKGTFDKFDFLIIVKENGDNIKKGYIVVFFDNSQKYKIIHRVSEIVVQDGVTLFQTKGDNNESPDNGYRTAEDIYAKFLVKIPYLGLIITFFSSNFGLMVIFINIWNAVLIMLLWKLDNNPEYHLECDYEELKEKWHKKSIW